MLGNLSKSGNMFYNVCLTSSGEEFSAVFYHVTACHSTEGSLCAPCIGDKNFSVIWRVSALSEGLSSLLCSWTLSVGILASDSQWEAVAGEQRGQVECDSSRISLCGVTAV